MAWTNGSLRHWKQAAPDGARPHAFYGPYQPAGPADLNQMLKGPSMLMCPNLKDWQIQGYSDQGIRFPLTLILETESPPRGDQPPYRYRLQTSARPLIRHGL